MKSTNSALAALLLVATSTIVTSFVPATNPNDSKSRAREGGFEALFLSPEDLTNYMAKAHEEKLRAIKEVEVKKDSEIKTLRGEVTALKESKATVPKESAVVVSSRPATGVDLSSMTTEELRAKLGQYQDFMAKYIVQAQQQKMKAVQAAEAATAAKYEGKIKLLLGASSSDSSTTTPSKIEAASVSSSADTKLYDTRNANVEAAAKAGKSRWGDKEVAKVKITPKSADVDVESKPKTDEVNGAKKVTGVEASAPSPVSLPGSTVFDVRNKKIAAAGIAGKSRWGDAEVEKASTESLKPSLSSAPSTSPLPAPAPAPVVVVSPEIEAADHGLRNDGGVGGPSLAERVNLGQQLFTGSDAAATAPPAPIVKDSPPSVYELRNARIARAAAAGKSRWGGEESSKATTLTAASKAISSSESAAFSAVAKKPEIVSTPEIEAADHGLRNDGGVGGPSLAERVNLGSGDRKSVV